MSMIQLTDQEIIDLKKRLYVAEVRKWIGTVEVGGDNRGEIVGLFQRAVDNKATKEPWCLGFQFYCIKEVDRVVDVMLQQCLPDHLRHRLYESEHVLTCWGKSPLTCRTEDPQIGSLMCWNRYGTHEGHAEAVVKLWRDNGVGTVGGNTSHSSMRNGDTVAEKTRSRTKMGGLYVLGYLQPWILD